jgi:hypothetical protein
MDRPFRHRDCGGDVSGRNGTPFSQEPEAHGACRRRVLMIMRTNRKTLKFTHPFFLKGIDRTLPAGDYQVVTDEEMIEGLSFPVYRRVSTMILVPSQFQPAASVEMVTVDPLDLQAALDQDAKEHR